MLLQALHNDRLRRSPRSPLQILSIDPDEVVTDRKPGGTLWRNRVRCLPLAECGLWLFHHVPHARDHGKASRIIHENIDHVIRLHLGSGPGTMKTFQVEVEKLKFSYAHLIGRYYRVHSFPLVMAEGPTHCRVPV